MKELRLHGRGGQGVKFAAQLIGRAVHLAGFKVQDFALYGAERRGAPLVSFVRFDQEPILTRGYVYAPDLIVIIDTTLPIEPCLAGRKEETPVLLNSPVARDGLITLNASDIAFSVLGRPTPNTTMAGAAVPFIPEIKLQDLLDAIDCEMMEKFPKKIVALNLEAAQKGYEAVLERKEQKDDRRR